MQYSAAPWPEAAGLAEAAITHTHKDTLTHPQAPTNTHPHTHGCTHAQAFTLQTLVEGQRMLGRAMGLVVDLTNTDKYYRPAMALALGLEVRFPPPLFTPLRPAQ